MRAEQYYANHPPSPPMLPVAGLPVTPPSIEQARDQLRRARNQQTVETNPEMMKQRQLFILDLESKIKEHKYNIRRMSSSRPF
eukprot:6180191-Pleurochrysis_carterae.AAC.1